MTKIKADRMKTETNTDVKMVPMLLDGSTALLLSLEPIMEKIIAEIVV